MITKISAKLDAIADHLEAKGLVKEAYELDKIADAWDSTENQKLLEFKANVKRFLKGSIPVIIKAVAKNIKEAVDRGKLWTGFFHTEINLSSLIPDDTTQKIEEAARNLNVDKSSYPSVFKDFFRDVIGDWRGKGFRVEYKIKFDIIGELILEIELHAQENNKDWKLWVKEDVEKFIQSLPSYRPL